MFTSNKIHEIAMIKKSQTELNISLGY